MLWKGSTKERTIHTLYIGFVFLAMMIFFTQLHPMVIYNMDDWAFLSYSRSVFPMMDEWNPARVLPEILQPLCAQIASRVVMLFGYDFVDAITIVYAFAVSVFIAWYVYCFDRLIQKKWDLPVKTIILLSLVFFLSHFWLLRSAESWNFHLFFSINTNCYFFYTIPALLNAIAIMTIETRESTSLKSLGNTASLLCIVYFAIFSNILQSMLLAIYVSMKLLVNIICNRKKQSFKAFLNDNMLFILTLIAWIISLFYEYFGMHGQSMFSADTIKESFNSTIDYLVLFANRINDTFLTTYSVVLAIAVIVSIVLLIQKRIKHDDFWRHARTVIILLGTSLVAEIYLILMCMVSSPWYISRADVQVSVMSLLLLITLGWGVSFLLKKYPKVAMVLPILVIGIYCESNTEQITYRNPNIQQLPAEVCATVTRHIIETAQTADDSNLAEVTINVPKFSSDSNWPIPVWGGDSIADALYKNGLTNKQLKIHLTPDNALNEKWNIPET